VAPGVRFERRAKWVTGDRVLAVLGDGEPKCLREVMAELGESSSEKVGICLRRLWKKGLILRTREPAFLREKVLKGRAGTKFNTRAVNYYVLDVKGRNQVLDFVEYQSKKRDGRDKGVKSKARKILEFLQQNKDKAFYSKDIVEALGVKRCDIMPNVRRFERKGLVFVRGYQTHDRRSPFSKGYVLTWVDQHLQREQAIREAFDRTNSVIEEEASSNKVLERARMIKDQLITSDDLLSLGYLQNVLRCTRDEIRLAVERAMQLYPEIKNVKVFNRYSYFYLNSLGKEKFESRLKTKQNYIRKMKGRDMRIGHNWEAVVEWFIDKFTIGAEFVTQKHAPKGCNLGVLIDIRKATERDFDKYESLLAIDRR